MRRFCVADRSEALECNSALTRLIGERLEKTGLPQEAVQVVEKD
jgi:glutamate-5-semialdehyde dehydrogenase